MAISSIALFLIFGKPVIMYLGIITLLSFLYTATIGLLTYNGIHLIRFRWHPRMGVISLILAVVHGVMGLSIFFGF